MKTHVLIFTFHNSNRLEYAAGFLLNELLEMSFSFTGSEKEFDEFSGPKINYSLIVRDESVQIIPSGLMEETGIREQKIKVSRWEGIPVIFANEQNSEIPFDIFSGTFYLLSRYEEYLPFIPDRHGRFHSRNSLALLNGFLEIPVINLWAIRLGALIEKKIRGAALKKKKFEWLSSIDVDRAWAYLNRNFLRTSGSLLKSLISGGDLSKKIRILKGIEKDPFFTFDYIRKLHSDDPLRVKFFFLSGKPGGADRNTDPRNNNWKELVSNLSRSFSIGLHPSIKSNKNISILREEKKTLENIFSGPINSSRQHYLFLKFPATYRNLIEAGIEHDYSMGYADHTGFRAGTPTPFYYYDIPDEKITTLRIYPFVVMDRTLLSYMKLDQEQSVKKIHSLIEAVYSSGGIFISLWHNDSLGDSGEWAGWRSVYSEMISYLKSKG